MLLKSIPVFFCRLSFLVSIIILSAGCAPSSTAVIDEEIVTNPKPMTTYKTLVIRDFELKPELFSDSTETPLDERERRYARVPSRLSEQIQRHISSRRIYKTVSRNDVPTATTLVLNGRFTRMGRFRISIEATLNDGTTGQEVAYFRQTLWDIVDTTEAVGRLGREVADFIDRIQYK